MCGIVGIVAPRGTTFTATRARKLLDLIRHRGPDGHGWLTLNDGVLRRGDHIDSDLRGEVVLLATRLAVFDPLPRAAQPFLSADAGGAIGFNGAVLNHRDLRRRLPDVQFRTGSDTETVLEVFRREGTAALSAFEG